MLKSPERMVQTSVSESENNRVSQICKDSLQTYMHESAIEDSRHSWPRPRTVDADPNSKTDSSTLKCSWHAPGESCSCSCCVTESMQFRELLLIHLDLIEQQNIKLELKEKIIQQLKSENDQLTARMNRMERRVALKIKRNTDEATTEPNKLKTCESVNPSRDYSARRHKADIIHKRSANYASGVMVTSKQIKDCSTGMHLKTNFHYLHSKDYPAYETSDKQLLAAKIQVPSWKDLSDRLLYQNDDCHSSLRLGCDTNDECTDDESYLRRHMKMELDEIRRKRWDIQQIRQERMQENLKQRQKDREDTKKTTPRSKNPAMHSLHPASKNVMAIEISDHVPVFALGSRVPQMESCEFELPWFDVAKKEIQYRQRSFKVSKRQKRKTICKY